MSPSDLHARTVAVARLSYKGPKTFNFGWFWVGFRSVLGRFSAKVGPGAVTNGPGLKNAVYINEN